MQIYHVYFIIQDKTSVTPVENPTGSLLCKFPYY
jgi:hypothetical protein